MTNWQTTKPDSPGVWWYCDGVSDEVQRWGVYGDGCDGGLDGGRVNCKGRIVDAKAIDRAPDGYWLKQDAPPAFIAPKPPEFKSDVWEARHRNCGNDPRWLCITKGVYVAADSYGHRTGKGDWSGEPKVGDEQGGYTLIRKVQP